MTSSRNELLCSGAMHFTVFLHPEFDAPERRCVASHGERPRMALPPRRPCPEYTYVAVGTEDRRLPLASKINPQIIASSFTRGDATLRDSIPPQARNHSQCILIASLAIKTRGHCQRRLASKMLRKLPAVGFARSRHSATSRVFIDGHRPLMETYKWLLALFCRVQARGNDDETRVHNASRRRVA